MIKTGLSKEDVIKFINVPLPLRMYAIQVDDNTLILHKIKDLSEIKHGGME
jgi:hypothetical protein